MASLNDIATQIKDSLSKTDASLKNVELEFRIHIKRHEREVIERILKHFCSNSEICCESQTINFIITDAQTSIIKTLTFVKGVKTSIVSAYSKRQLIAPIFTSVSGIDIKASVSEELKITTDSFDSQRITPSLLRGRHRISIEPQDHLNWRIDVSLTKTGPISTAVEVRDKLFPKTAGLQSWDYGKLELEVEYIGDLSKFSVKDMDFIQTLIDMAGYEEVSSKDLFLFKKLIGNKHSKTLKTTWNSAKELTKKSFAEEVKPLENFYITPKMDGTRAIMIIEEGKCRFLTQAPMKTPTIETKNADDFQGLTVADGEIQGDQFFIFHALSFNDESLVSETFEKSLPYIKKIAEFNKEQLPVKPFLRIVPDSFPKQFNDLLTLVKKRGYETDGIIFVSASDDYLRTKNYKWKPIEQTTVDFLLKPCPEKLIGIEPYMNKPKHKLYVLFCGIDSDLRKNLGIPFLGHYNQIFSPEMMTAKYQPIQFMPSACPLSYLYWDDSGKDLDGQICEMYFDAKKYQWSMHRIREDKKVDADQGIAFGNDFRIAEMTWMNYFNPLSVDHIVGKKSLTGYFKESDVDAYRAMRNYVSFVKTKLLEPYIDVNYVIDLGSGKGQDLNRYRAIGAKNLICLEFDIDALAELTSRKYSSINVSVKSQKTTSIYTKQIDLNDEKATRSLSDELTACGVSIPKKGADLVVCNLAFHYFTSNQRAVKHIVELVNSLLAPGGSFIYTAFDGQKVNALLNKPENKSGWEVKENGVVKYAIYRSDNFKFGDSLAPQGQMIKQKLPFSGDQLYTEPLVNDATIEKAFARYKIKKQIYECFDVRIENYERDHKTKISNVDRQWIELFYFAIYRKG